MVILESGFVRNLTSEMRLGVAAESGAAFPQEAEDERHGMLLKKSFDVLLNKV